MSSTVNRVLLAGGAGFIGSHIADLLVSQGKYVRVLDDFSSGKMQNLQQHEGSQLLEVLRGDVLDRNLVDDAVENVDAIINMVGKGNLAKSVDDPRPYHDVNLTGSVNLLTSAVHQGIKKYIGASSGSVYSEEVSGRIGEDSPLGPQSPYAASKLCSEIYGNSFNITYGIECVNLRFFNVYGPRRENSAYHGAVTGFMTSLIQGRHISLFGTGEDKRDYVYVKDIAKAVVGALKVGVSGSYNVGTGEGTSTNNLIKKIESTIGVTAVVEKKPKRKGDTDSRIANTEKAHRDFSYTPSYTLDSGLRELYDYLREIHTA